MANQSQVADLSVRRDAEISDVAIVGGGPAGLSAALVLGRACKHVVVLDGGARRNAVARQVHGMLTRDGVTPDELRALGHAELVRYPSVTIHLDVTADDIVAAEDRFIVRAGGREHAARRLLLCCGLIDELPPIDGCAQLWGKGVYACPYCDGWEVRGRSLAFLAPDRDSLTWALLLRSWSTDVTVFTSGAFPVPPDARRALEEGGVRVEERRVIGLARRDDALAAVRFDGGGEKACDALFVRPHQRQVPVVVTLGLELTDGGFVRVDDEQQTSIPGIYAAGDLVCHDHGALSAAASGSRAAHYLNHELTVALTKARLS
jgi:thioredoxin reductase